MDLRAGDQRKPEFLALNPNGKVPTLVVDGTPMFEGLAIMLWLGDSYGVAKQLWPSPEEPARCSALAWSVWSYVSYGGALGRYFLATSQRLGAEYHNAAQAAFAKKELDGLLHILDERLSAQPFVLGDRFMLVDLIAAAMVGYGVFGGVTIDGYAHVQRWHRACQARPSFRTVMTG
jgi:GST-like protein